MNVLFLVHKYKYHYYFINYVLCVLSFMYLLLCAESYYIWVQCVLLGWSVLSQTQSQSLWTSGCSCSILNKRVAVFFNFSKLLYNDVLIFLVALYSFAVKCSCAKGDFTVSERFCVQQLEVLYGT